MDELRGRPNHELLEVATSKNYGRATRSAAREILAERGVTLDATTFENPSAGSVPDRPDREKRSRFMISVIVTVVIAIVIAFIRFVVGV